MPVIRVRVEIWGVGWDPGMLSFFSPSLIFVVKADLI